MGKEKDYSLALFQSWCCEGLIYSLAGVEL